MDVYLCASGFRASSPGALVQVIAAVAEQGHDARDELLAALVIVAQRGFEGWNVACSPMLLQLRKLFGGVLDQPLLGPPYRCKSAVGLLYGMVQGQLCGRAGDRVEQVPGQIHQVVVGGRELQLSGLAERRRHADIACDQQQTLNPVVEIAHGHFGEQRRVQSAAGVVSHCDNGVRFT